MGSLQIVSIANSKLKARLKDMSKIWQSLAKPSLRDRRGCTPKLLCKQLLPWSNAKDLSKSVPLKLPPITLTNHTDVSLKGWGRPLPEKVGSKGVVAQIPVIPYNILKAMAVFLSLKRINQKRCSHIHLMMDNNTIVHCIIIIIIILSNVHNIHMEKAWRPFA